MQRTVYKSYYKEIHRLVFVSALCCLVWLIRALLRLKESRVKRRHHLRLVSVRLVGWVDGHIHVIMNIYGQQGLGSLIRYVIRKCPAVFIFHMRVYGAHSHTELVRNQHFAAVLGSASRLGACQKRWHVTSCTLCAFILSCVSRCNFSVSKDLASLFVPFGRVCWTA